MQKKQKDCLIIICIIAMIASIITLVLFTKYDHLRTIYPETNGLVYDMTVNEIENIIGVKEEWIDSSHVLCSLYLTSSERVLMFECKEEYEEKIINAVHKYIDTLKEQFKNSSEIQYVNTYKELNEKDYYVLIISSKADMLAKEIKERL